MDGQYIVRRGDGDNDQEWIEQGIEAARARFNPIYEELRIRRGCPERVVLLSENGERIDAYGDGFTWNV